MLNNRAGADASPPRRCQRSTQYLQGKTYEMTRDIFHSIAGTFAPILGVITSLQEQLEYGLRISGLVVGLIVGLLSLWQILKKL